MRSERTVKLFIQIVLTILLALFCLLISAPPDRRPIFEEALQDYKVNLGLDLRGGAELLYKVDPADIDPTRSEEEVIGETIEVISQRIYESGIVKEPRIQRQGENRILIQLPDLNKQDTNKIKATIEELGNLEFRLVASKRVGQYGLEEEKERDTYEKRKKRGGKSFELYKERLRKKGYQWFPSRKDEDTGIAGPDRLLLIEDGYDITGKKFANFRKDDFGNIQFELNSEGREDFADLTSRHVKEYLAIVFNGKVWASPVIESEISRGSGILKGFRGKELTELLQTLRSGSLEVQPELLHENTIGPSLGEDAIRLGISAGLFGLAMVLIFMAVYYWAAGIFASLALMFNIAIVFAILVISRETLTLPGIAGLLLTVGMSIDANIIIFERIREEKKRRWERAAAPEISRKGRQKNQENQEQQQNGSEEKPMSKEELLENVDRGYQQAFWTIFDANVTTLLTAFILYNIATGAVQGFAFTMLWGVLASFFTAIFVTRIFINFSIDIGLVKQLKMLELVKNPQFGIVSKMRAAGICSLLLVVLGMVCFVQRGDSNYGLDLKGGVLAQISLDKPLTTDTVRARLNENLGRRLEKYDETPEVQHIKSRFREGSSTDGWYEFSIRLRNLNEKEIEKINEDLSHIGDQIREIHRKLTNVNKARYRNLSKRNRVRDEILELTAQQKNGEDVATDLEAKRAERRRISDEIRELEKQRDNLLEEMAKWRSQRSDKILEKNKLSGITQLREAIDEEFENELSKLPFGQIYEVKGDFHCALPVNMKTPVTLDFLEKSLSEIKTTAWIDVGVGVSDYRVQFKAPSSLANPQQELPQLLKKHLELARAELSDDPFELSERQGKWQVVIHFAKPFAISTLEEVLTTRCKFEEVESEVAVPAHGDNYVNSFAVFAEVAGGVSQDQLAAIQEKVEQQLRDKFREAEIAIDGEEAGVHFSEPFPRFTQISAVVAEAMKVKASRAIGLALIMILIYIAIRFPNGLRFGFAAVVALVHDICITLGAIAVFAHFDLVDVDITLPVIAALLTIVGYSLNDTIVIFDRIRENQRKEEMWERLPMKAVKSVYNNSLNQTLSRTVLTSLTTLFVVTTIFVLNRGHGSVMEGFSFALIVGVIAGTYSSLFIASTIVLWFESGTHPDT